MPQISLTDLVDIVSKSGVSKATKVLQVKDRPSYQPAFDYYKDLRDEIIKAHKHPGTKKALSRFLDTKIDPRKRENYEKVLIGYLKWLGYKKFEWFEPVKDTYSRKGVDVIINPELGLVIKGKPYLVKLYFKNESLSKLRVDLIIGFMDMCLRKRLNSGTKVAVLDIRNAKLFIQTSKIKEIQKILDAELSYIANIWS